MDLAELKRRFDKSRERELTVGARTFTVRLPSRSVSALVVEAEESRGVAIHALLVDAIVGWRGVVAGDLDIGAEPADEPLPCVPATVTMFLDARLEVLAELAPQFLLWLNERARTTEAARKNSPSASSGN